MIFGQNRDELRQMYLDAWRKAEDGELMSPLEAQIAAVIREHPEYHDVFAAGSLNATIGDAGDAPNPFLHMGLHLALREQVATDRPAGIRSLVNSLARATGNLHDAEHKAIECLAETLWEAQRANQVPDEAAYLDRLRKL